MRLVFAGSPEPAVVSLRRLLDSDAHEVRSQAYVELGVAMARRGWLTKDDVVNTRTWKQLEKLRKKRP